MFLRLLPRRLAFLLVTIAITLILVGFVTRITMSQSGSDTLQKISLLFYVDEEANIPAWFSGCLLLMVSQLFIIIGLYRRYYATRDGNQWVLMGLLFAALSCDEVASLHEKLITPVRSILNTSGVLYWAWIVPVVIVLIGVIIYFRPFVMQMPAAIRRGFLAAVTIFLTGTLILEMVGGVLFEQTKNDLSILYQLEAHTEELLEMMAVILVIYILLKEVLLFIPGVDVNHESLLNPNNKNVSQS